MPTRLPYGLSFIKPGDKAKAYTFPYTATPSVKLGTVFFNSDSAITITNFTGGERGKIIIVDCNSSSIMTLQNSAGGINIRSLVYVGSAPGYLLYSSTGNLAMIKQDAVMFVHNGTDWDQVGSLVRGANG
jgi:hypothetical protein